MKRESSLTAEGLAKVLKSDQSSAEKYAEVWCAISDAPRPSWPNLGYAQGKLALIKKLADCLNGVIVEGMIDDLIESYAKNYLHETYMWLLVHEPAKLVHF